MDRLLIFALGAALGSVVTWKLVKTKYEQIAQEEIESVKEVFSRREKDDAKKTVEELQDLKDLLNIVEKNGYTDYANNSKEKKEESIMIDEPYVIPPDEFGELDGYETISLNYYADGFVADDFDNVIDDVDSVIGLDSLDHFGEYEDDSVFVRNDALRTDYEILIDRRNFRDVKGDL